MSRRLPFFLILCSLCCFAENYGDLPLAFEPEGAAGQFIARAPAFDLVISPDGALFSLSGKRPSQVRMRLEGGSSQSRVTPGSALAGRANYLIGPDATQWRTGVPQFGSIRAAEVLPRTDIVYYGNGRRLEFDLVLHPGADPGRLLLRFEGAESQEIDAAGNLILNTSAGEIVQHAPRIQQNGKHIEGKFLLEPGGAVRIVVGEYDRSRELRIDPVISYSTYLGGSSDDSPNAVAVDASGNTYIAGVTSSFNFPVSPGAVRTTYPSTSRTVAFVAKMNPSGTGLVYATYLGGSGLNSGDAASAIAVDASGNTYIAGVTGSADFPVVSGSLSTSLNGPTDAFVAKLNPAGNALLYSTYLGGSGKESAAGIAIDAAGDAFITGSTSSSNFPFTAGAPQTVLKSANDAFVAKLNPAGRALIYATYLGGSAEDDANAIAVDSAGNAYIAGTTASVDFPVSRGAFQTVIGPSPVAFVAKLAAAGTSISYATYLGGTGGDNANSIAVDSAGSAYIAGTTYSADFPVTAGAANPMVPGTPALGHGFVSKLNSTGAALLYSTYFGGYNADGATGLAVDASGNAVVTGLTSSTNFPISANSLDPVANFSTAAFLIKLNPAATAVLYSTLIGASGSSSGQAVALDSSGHAYIAGTTNSVTFPVSPGAFQISNSALSSLASTGFVAKIDLGSTSVCAISLSPASVSFPFAGGTATVNVVAPAGCAWEATAGASWLTVNLPSSGVGPGLVSITAGSNAMSASTRSASASAGSAALNISQLAGSCATPQLSPASQSLGMLGSSSTITVAIPPGCAVTAVSGAAWITIDSVSTGPVDAVVGFTVAANAGSTRTGIVTVAGTPYSVTQSGAASCTFTVSPAALTFPFAGGSLSAAVAAAGGCVWTVSTLPSWLTANPTNGTGNGTIVLLASSNATGASRNAAITIAGQSLGVTQLANSPPTADSVTPSSSSGPSQTFTMQFSDPNGFAGIGTIYFYFAGSNASGTDCAFFYDTVRSGLYLFAQNFASSYGPLTPGSSSTIQHVACGVTGTNFTTTASGNHLTLSVPIVFQSLFAGSYTLHASTSSIHTGLNTGDAVLGTFNASFATNSPPTADSVTPSSGSGSSQTFAMQFSDPNGFADIGTVYFYFAGSNTSGTDCAFFYDTVRNGLYLFAQNFASAYGPVAPGASSSIQHVACGVTGTNFSVTKSGNHLTLSVPIVFQALFAGTYTLHASTSSIRTGLSTGDATLGTYNVSFVSNSPPTADSLTPSSGAGSSQTFTMQFSDPNGYADLGAVYFYFAGSNNSGTDCAFWYDPSRGGLYLFAQNFASSYGPLTPGSSATIQHVACGVTGTNFSVSTSGNHLTLSVPIVFQPLFAGSYTLHASTSSIRSGLSTGDVVLGTFAASFFANSPPTADSLTPNSGSGSSQTFTMQFSDPNGFADIGTVYFYLAGSNSSGTDCAFFYDTVRNGLYLFAQNFASSYGPLAPGSPSTIQHVACGVTGTNLSVTKTGNHLTLSVPIVFQPLFAGSYTLHANTSSIHTGLSTGDVALGTFTVHF